MNNYNSIDLKQSKGLVAKVSSILHGNPMEIDQIDISEQDWEPLLATMQWHNVEAYCASVLLPMDIAAMPIDVRNSLKQAQKLEASFRFQQAAVLCEIVNSFEREDIDYLLLKGEAISARFYPEGTLRQSNDVDLLVSPRDFSKAEALLEKSGFVRTRPSYSLTTAMRSILKHITSGMDFQRPSDGVIVELHWRLLQNPHILPWSWDEMFARSQTMSVGATSVRVLDGPSQLVYLICHGAKHGWHRLKWLLDIHVINGRLTTEERAEVRIIAKAAVVDRLLEVGLALCARYFGNGTIQDTISFAGNRLMEFPITEIEYGMERDGLAYRRFFHFAYQLSLKKSLRYRITAASQRLYALRDIDTLGLSVKALPIYIALGPVFRLKRIMFSDTKL